MNTEALKSILSGNKIIEFIDDDQDLAHGLRLLIIDNETHEVGELAIEPRVLVLPDEAILDYSYQAINYDAGRPEHGYDVLTRIGPDYDASNVPFLKDGQSGLFN